MKRSTRILSMLLAMLMILTSALTVSATTTEPAQPTTWWSDNAAEGFAGGKGTAEEPYEIATPAQLAYFANYLEGGALNGKTEKTYFKITENIDMSAHQWKPVGYTSPVTVVEGETTTNTYAANTLNQAVLDGNGKLVSGVKLTASQAIKDYTYDYGCAMFTKIVDSTIQNLTLEVKILDPVLTADKTTTFTAGGSQNLAVASSGVAALAAGTFGSTTIDNVTVALDMDVNATGGEYLYAGLVAYALQNTVLTNSTTSGTMDITMPATTAGYFGGVLGRYFAKEITNLTNKTTMNIVGTKGSYYGGVVALTQTGPKGGNLVNEGAMNITLATGGWSYVGGVFAQAAVLRTAMGACHNKGNISVTLSTVASYIGGVAGYVGHYETNMDGYTNSGNISITKTAIGTNPFYAGGIVGQLDGTKDKTAAKVVNCVNTGSITATFPEEATKENCQPYVGGIVANCVRGEVTSCTNRGAISVLNTYFTHRTGGIVGNQGANAGAKIDNCINFGDLYFTDAVVAGDTRFVGGICGNLGSLSMVNCVNNGNITVDGATCAYAIGGLSGNGNGGDFIVDNCTNNGNITVNHANGNYHRNTGGLFGTSNTNKGTFKNSTNNGKIFSNGVVINAYLGGLISQAAGTVKLENCVNNGEVEMTAAASAAGGNRYVGGIIGSINSGSVSLIKTVNNGTVKGSGVAGTWDVGGIAGYVAGSSTIDGCENHGLVEVRGSSNHYVAGIAGYYNIGAGCVFQNCINTGEIIAVRSGTSGNVAVAGIISRPSNDAYVANATLTIKNCLNYGKITDGSLSGGIVGYSATSRKKLNSSDSAETIQPYTVTYENCVSLKSGTTYGMIGSNRADHTVFINCFTDTEYVLSYYNQGILYADGQTLTINGIACKGNDIKYNPETGCYSVMLDTMDKGQVKIVGTTEEATLRFNSSITKESYDTIAKITTATVEVGTMIAPTEYLKIASVEAAYDKMAALDALTAVGEAKKYYTSAINGTDSFLDPTMIDGAVDGSYYFAGEVTVGKEDFATMYTAIAYVRVTAGDFSFALYADYDSSNTDRSRSVAQIAKAAYEDRATASTGLNGWLYNKEATAENACYLGAWSIYKNEALTLLKAYCSYVNNGTVPTGLSVNGVAISEYKIVYAQSPIHKYYGSNTGKTLYEDLHDLKMPVYTSATNATGEYVDYGDVLLGAKYDYDYQTANRIKTLIKNKYGVELEVVEDVKTEETKYEILVGVTNRAKSMTTEIASLGVDQFIFRIDGTKIVVCGGSFGATWHAADKLQALLTTITGDYNLKMAGNLDGSYRLQKIACIGDSITRGSQALPDGSTYGGPGGATGMFGANATAIYFEQFLSYPANLQRLMWKDAVVYNFGRGASTARNFGNTNYYASSPQWQNCLATSNDPDVAFDLVFMMHGTNDSTQDGGAGAWGSNAKADFQKEVKFLMDEILKGSPNAKFVLNNVPHRFDTSTDNTNELNTMAMRKIQKEVAMNLLAMGYDVYHFDMNVYIRETLVEGTCKCPGYSTVIGSGEQFDSVAEVDKHGYYYNTETPYTRCEGTHPNFRGYHLIADGIKEVVDYILNGKKAPEHMIDITQ